MSFSYFPCLFQVIPRQLCDDAGFDATDVLNKLRQKHALPSGKCCIIESYHMPHLFNGLARMKSNFLLWSLYRLISQNIYKQVKVPLMA